MPAKDLVRVAGADLDGVQRALEQAWLPADDIREDITEIYRLDDEAGAIGFAALECFGESALLRSVLILDHRRDEGAGTDLIHRIIDLSRARGIGHLWLLTETATSFFGRLGFRAVVREAAPEAIRNTSEFRTVCPASAQCMSLDLRR